MKTKLIKLFALLLISSVVYVGCGDGGGDEEPSTTHSNIYVSSSGVTWQYPETRYQGTWQEGITYCQNLEWAGYSDWRLPSIETVNYDIGNFTFIQDGVYWSKNEKDAENALTYSLSFGGSVNLNENKKSDIKDVVCVRGTYNSSNDLSVVDPLTHIEWQDSPLNDAMVYNWQEAMAYCDTLKYAGKEDWFLPSIDMLDSTKTLVYKYGTKSSMWSSTVISSSEVNIFFTGDSGGLSSDNIDSQHNVRCARMDDADRQLSSDYYGRWVYVDKSENGSKPEVVMIDKNTFFTDYTIVDKNLIRVGTRYLVRAGISNVKLTGALAVISSPSSSSSSSRSSALPGVASIRMVISPINNSEAKKEIDVVGTLDESLMGKTIDGKLYVADPATTDDRYVIPKESNLSMPTGETEIKLIDERNNSATFSVNVVGEETDMGVLTVTDKPYNFKSYIESGNDWIYFGYEDEETPLAYKKTLKICNVGTESISGVSFDIALDDNASDIKRAFSTDYDGAAIPFTSGECKSYEATFSFKRPAKDREVKINVTIHDNFNALIWNDYTSLKVSQYPEHKLYFNSNSKTLNGFLVAPGRNLINVQFSNTGENNFVRVPLVNTDSYDLIMSTPNISDEDVYMISSGFAPDTTKMNGFTLVLTNEPDNSESNATKLALEEGESIAYLSKGDIDFYKILDKPNISHLTTKVYYTDINITIPMVTELNISSITANTLKLSNKSGGVAGKSIYNAQTNTFTFDPDSNLSAGTYTVTLDKSLESLSGFKLEKDLSFDIEVLAYPSSAQVVSDYQFDNINTMTTYKNYLYVVGIKNTITSKRALYLLDISNPSSPIEKGSYIDDTHLRDVDTLYISGDYLYAAGVYNTTINIFDISKPEAPLLKSSIATDRCDGLVTSGDYLYALFGSALKIFDISDKASPLLKGTLDGLSGPNGIDIIDNFVYLADAAYGLSVINVSDLDKPILEGSLTDLGTLENIYVSNGLAYVTGRKDEINRLYVIDISNPATPVLRGSVNLLGDYFHALEVSGNFAYVTADKGGLQIIDISNASNPRLVKTVEIGDDAYDLAVSGNFAYVNTIVYIPYGTYQIEIINIQMYR